jgi:hypothetical protein
MTMLNLPNTMQLTHHMKELQAAKIGAEAEGEPFEEPRRFNTEQMAIALLEISSAVVRF